MVANMLKTNYYNFSVHAYTITLGTDTMGTDTFIDAVTFTQLIN